MVVLGFSGPSHHNKISRCKAEILTGVIIVFGVVGTVRVLDRGAITGGPLLLAHEVADLTEQM